MNVNMDTSPLVASMAGYQTGDGLGIYVLKKAMDIQAQNAAALVAAVPQPQSANNLPAHLGQNINTTA